MAAPASDVQALRQQVAALQLDHALNLSSQQAQALLPLLQEAKAQVQSLKAQRVAAQPALETALAQAVTDLKTSGSVSAATTQAVNAARPANGAMRDSLRALFEQARQVLTPDQQQALRTAPLGIPQSATASVQPAGGHPGSGRRFRAMHVVLSDAFISLVQARAG
jgi:hypothetical protein